MAISPEIRSDSEHMALLDELIAERGVKRYGLYLLSGEALFTPDGYEETSGFVVSDDGRIFFFWTGWDETAHRVRFETWRPTEPQPGWQNSAEYQDARRAAGLA